MSDPICQSMPVLLIRVRWPTPYLQYFYWDQECSGWAGTHDELPSWYPLSWYSLPSCRDYIPWVDIPYRAVELLGWVYRDRGKQLVLLPWFSLNLVITVFYPHNSIALSMWWKIGTGSCFSFFYVWWGVCSLLCKRIKIEREKQQSRRRTDSGTRGED